MTEPFARIPLGISDFPMLREAGGIYVDKSELIWRLAATTSGRLFFARPRRFGKSLLVSTFASLFEHGLRDFKGLRIEELWTETRRYRVVRLDFSSCREFSDYATFERKFRDEILVKFRKAGFRYDPNDPVNWVGQLGSWLEAQSNASLVLLVDEYDAPLTHSLDRGKLFERVRQALSDFFGQIKSNDGCLRFLFLTGITRFSRTNLFSGFNNLRDISLEPEYGALLGYTEEELLEAFAEPLREASEVLRLPPAALLTQLRTHYDGFVFEKSASTHVYCPWSVLSFLANRSHAFENYWFESGGQPTALMRWVAKRKLEKPMAFCETVPMDPEDLLAGAVVREIDPNVLLQQTGYLTIRSVEKSGLLRLGYPNREVAASMARLYSDVWTSGRLGSVLKLVGYFYDGDAEKVVDFCRKFFNTFDYQSPVVLNEAMFRAYMQTLFFGTDLMTHVEVHSAKGRSDLEVETEDVRWVFELKFARRGCDPKALLNEALLQMREKRYGISPHGRRLIRVGVVFEEEARNITLWERLPESAVSNVSNEAS